MRDTGERRPARIDWWGNLTFALGLVGVMIGITYGIQPYGGHTMGWTNPYVLAAIIGGIVVLGWVLRLTFALLGPIIVIGLAVLVYLALTKRGP